MTGQAVLAGCAALEPTIDIAQQDAAGIGRGAAEVARPTGTAAQLLGAGEGPLTIRGHDRLAGRAAGRRIAQAQRVFGQEPRAAPPIAPRLVGTRLGQHLDAIPSRIDRHQTEADQPAQAPHRRVPVATAPGARIRSAPCSSSSRLKPRFISTTKRSGGSPGRSAAMSQPQTSPFTANPAVSRNRFIVG
jgi:hypothetical protein